MNKNINNDELINQIIELKKSTDTVILAHYYQDEDIQDIADFIGDSLDLTKNAQKVSQNRILFAGVHFMAETAKILNPQKTVIVPDINAGCSLADSCNPAPFAYFKSQNPDHLVISYINCSAEIKAMSDIICTSSNAVQIVNSIPKEQKIIFAPDRFLGAWVQKQTGRKMLLWNGSCQVHETFSEKKLIALKTNHPQAKIIAHPECPENILGYADFIGSTKRMLEYATNSSAEEIIVITEPGIIYQMKKQSPNKNFIPLGGEEESCACNTCPYMRLNTLEKIHMALISGEPQINIDEKIRQSAEKSLLAMLARS